MATIEERRSVLAESKVLFDGFREMFNPLGKLLFAIPELKPVLGLFQGVADVANARKGDLRAAIDESGLETGPPLTPAQEARAKQAVDEITAALRSFETETGLAAVSIVVKRGADGAVDLGSAFLLR